jgi:hypothetical protein
LSIPPSPRPGAGDSSCSALRSIAIVPGDDRMHLRLGQTAPTPPTPPDLVRCRRKQGPIQFLENNPIQSSFRVRFMCPKTRRNWLRRPIVRFHPGSSCPQAAALRRSHTRGGYRHFRAIHALVGIRSTFAMPHLAESSEHFHAVLGIVAQRPRPVPDAGTSSPTPHDTCSPKRYGCRACTLPSSHFTR